ncbi:hypothetical protein NLJ89_g9955 [Agrocybe chaxingu]|uniref:Uncharacterized protein n=1 Tax=Agrocybe chaxingu TaxID=84603 RepID=A0A9W8MRC4_9AGAR|nr:hypothetical protein NLJ89_g9955 [Agrocybe chaxingu]
MALQPLTELYPAIWAKPPPSKTKITSLVQIQYEVFDNADGTGSIIARNIFANTEDPEYEIIGSQRSKVIFRLATWMQWILAEVHLDAQETDKAFKRTLSYYIGFHAKLLDDFIDGVADNLYKWLFIQHRVGKQNPEAVRSSGLSRIDMLWQATNCQLEATTREVALRWGFAHLHSKMCFGDLGSEDRAKIKKYAREWIRTHSIVTVKKANPQGRLLQAVSSTSRMAEVLPPSARTEKKNIKEEDDKPDMRNSSQTDETEERLSIPF